MIKAIFFDFDGVIVESVDIKTKAFAKLFEKEGETLVKKVVDYHLKNTGVSRFDKFKYIYKEMLKQPLTESVFKGLCDRFASIVLDEVVRAPYVKGADEFLKKFSKKYMFFILSATPQGEIKEIAERRGIKGFFKEIYGAPTKKVDAVRNLLAKESIYPKEAVYIGDAMSDYLAAKENGVHFIARIKDNEEIFKGIDCRRIEDLLPLANIVDSL